MNICYSFDNATKNISYYTDTLASHIE
jgi:hypothetical protein